MDKRIGLFAGLMALVAMGSAEAVDCPATWSATDINDATGHVFEVYKADGIGWSEAAACADKYLNDDPNAVKGHLATITSDSENQWVVGLLTESLSTTTPEAKRLTKSQVWVGGFQDKTGITAPGVGDGWRWVNNEGRFSGTNNNPAMPGFTNWAANEPNDGDKTENGTEDHLTIGRYYAGNPDVTVENRYVWNDEGAAPTSIGGFIVEYDTPRTVGACDGGTTACTTIEGQTLTFPPNTTGNITFSAYEFTDPRVGPDNKCTILPRKELKLFGEEDGFAPGEELKIPAYLCGSPKFVVVKVKSTDLSQTALDGILKGAVLVENKTDQILPGNVYKCFDPLVITTAPLDTLYAPDPQYQDVVVWQSTDPTRMFEETAITSTRLPDYFGAATEATNGCGSTTAKVRGASYFVVGMHIDFGAATYDYDPNRQANYNQFVALTQYKLALLRKSVDDARLYGSVKKPDWQAMSSQLKNAVSKLSAGDPAGALSSMQQFVFKVNSSIYSPATAPYVGFNFNGDHLMRGENIVFTLRVKVVPYKPVP